MADDGLKTAAQNHVKQLRSVSVHASDSSNWQFLVVQPPVPLMSRGVPATLHVQPNGLDVQITYKRKTFQVQRAAYGERQSGWYAVVGAGSAAVALLAGEAIATDNLRLLKRAKLGTGQFGMARDLGAGRVILGYLRHDNDRNTLMPYYTQRRGQNFAALTLSFKH